MKYDFKIDLGVKNNSHSQLIQRIKPQSSILELGCATGYMSEYLTQQLNCTVTGVELDTAAAALAEKHCDKVICANVEHHDWLKQLEAGSFDVILCADIIEHLRAPLDFLQKIGFLLKSDGVLIASLPNGAHAALRLELLAGQFKYEETGLLDRTHLHLFTYQSIYQVFQQAGYAVDELSYTFHDLADEVINQQLNHMDLAATDGFLARMHAPEAAAFQYVVVASINHQNKQKINPFPALTTKPLKDSFEVYQHLTDTLKAANKLIAHQKTQIEAHIENFKQAEQTYQQERQFLKGSLSDLSDYSTSQNQQKITAIEKQQYLKAREQQQQTEITAQKAKIKDLEQQLNASQQLVEAIYNSRTWRSAKKLFALFRWYKHRNIILHNLKQKFSQKSPQSAIKQAAPLASPLPPLSYESWIAEKEPLTIEEIIQKREFLADLHDQPLISIIMPVYNVKAEYLLQAIDSVIQQSYPKWQLCIADDASDLPHIRSILIGMKNRDQRIKVIFKQKNEHIVAASQSAINLAEGDYIGFLDHDDLLAKDALYHVAQAIKQNPAARLLYSDEDKINEKNERFAHYFKPDYNPDLMYSHNMICHFGVYHFGLFKQLGGLRDDYQGAQDYDLALRFIENIKPAQIQHISRILYHWRAIPESTALTSKAKPYAINNAAKAVSRHLIAQGYQQNAFKVTENPYIDGMLRVQYFLPDNPPLVSIIIPTKNGVDLLKQCIESIQNKTDYANYEIIVVDNQSDEQRSIEYMQQLAAQKKIKLIPYDDEFNYSAINNFAVKQAKGELLAFLNNDIEVVDHGWLTEMVSHAIRPQIGAVGCRLWYPDDRLQHGGVILGLGGVAGHAMKYMPKKEKGYNGRAVLIQNYSAVTAACLVMKKTVFEQINGFNDQQLKIAFNDVDLCLRIGELGLRLVWTPFANLVHHESATRGYEDTPEKKQRFQGEVDYMLKRWGNILPKDPAYNQNLTHCLEDFSMNYMRIIK